MVQRQTRKAPRWILIFLPLSLVIQSVYYHQIPRNKTAQALPQAPSVEALRVMSMGDPLLSAKLLMLWLQVFDNQPGVSIPFKDLDYQRVEAWLRVILSLDPRSQYPLLAASRLYTDVPDQGKQYRMTEFVYEYYLKDPARRWPWLAHVTILAKHRLHNLELALKYARALADSPDESEIPNWARQLAIFILEDKGELDSARVLIGGLLNSGNITDKHEIQFLKSQLERLEAASNGGRVKQ